MNCRLDELVEAAGDDRQSQRQEQATRRQTRGGGLQQGPRPGCKPIGARNVQVPVIGRLILPFLNPYRCVASHVVESKIITGADRLVRLQKLLYFWCP